MSIELKFKKLEAYLFVEAGGPFTNSSVKQAIKAVRDKADALECTRILIDARKVSEPDGQLTRYYTGEYFAEFLPQPFKVALIKRHDDTDRFTETVAVNRGANYWVFSDEETAIQWLAKK